MAHLKKWINILIEFYEENKKMQFKIQAKIQHFNEQFVGKCKQM